jgi:nucleotide-binding universal stress UspA family protein
MIRRILVPLDGSPKAEAALGHAVAIAESLDAELVLLRIVEAQLTLGDPVVSSVDWRLHRVEATAYLRDTRARLEAQGTPASIEVREGRAADEILRFLTGRGAELVVLAAHGLGEASDFPFGGTVHKIVARVPASVMIVRPTAEARAVRERVRYRRVLVPVDGSPASEWALSLAASVARTHGAELLLSHIVPKVEIACARIPCSAQEAELLARLEQVQHERGHRFLREMESHLGQEDLRVRYRVLSASQVPQGIQQIAAEEGADLIALSAHGAVETVLPYGKIAQHLLGRTEIPVLVFQDRPGTGSERPASPSSER